MAKIYAGNTAAGLAGIPKADISDGDTARIFLNGAVVQFEFDDSATNATATSENLTTPYYIRPDDYGAGPGVWVENAGALQVERYNAGQIIGSKLLSTNWGASAGSEFDLDLSTLKLGGSDVNVALDTTPGIFMGLDSGAYKLSIGKAYGDADAQSFFKWDGSAMAIRLASGETFELYGDLNVKIGGDVTLESDFTTGNAAKLIFDNNYGVGSFYKYYMRPAATSSKHLYLYPEDDGNGYLYLGDPTHTQLWHTIKGYATNQCRFTAYYSSDMYAALSAVTTSTLATGVLSSNGGASNSATVITHAGSARNIQLAIDGSIHFVVESGIARVLNAALGGSELSADPSNPPEGDWILWQSDGTGSGDDGDMMMKITAGGSTKITTLVDFSEI